MLMILDQAPTLVAAVSSGVPWTHADDARSVSCARTNQLRAAMRSPRTMRETHRLRAATVLVLAVLAGCHDNRNTDASAADGGALDADGNVDSGSDIDHDADGDSRPDSDEEIDHDRDIDADADRDADESVVLRATNPVLAGDHPDPHVLRTMRSDGRPVYYLTATVHNSGDIPIYRSEDLIHWERMERGASDRTSTPGSSLAINEGHFCSIWAPQIVELGPGSFMLSFSAERFSSPQSPCPGYSEAGGVYLAWSSSPEGPFAPVDHPWEPIPAGGHITECALRDSLPRSLWTASRNCQGTWCHYIIQLDSDVFRDPVTDRWWMAYSWFTNSPPMVDWERGNHGEHVHVVELDPADPFTVICDPAVPQVFVANPHDAITLERLRRSCDRCGEMLSMTRGRFDEEVQRDGCSWGVAEGANLFRRGGYVYAMISGSLWDSGYYHVFWIAAPSVEELSLDNAGRLVGRYLVPSRGQAFGHGQAVLGPDGETWYFVHHRLDHAPCRDRGECSRDVWVSPIELDDRGDGFGDVWIVPRFPAETPEVEIRVLAAG
jgi:hypothetical protein